MTQTPTYEGRERLAEAYEEHGRKLDAASQLAAMKSARRFDSGLVLRPGEAGDVVLRNRVAVPVRLRGGAVASGVVRFSGCEASGAEAGRRGGPGVLARSVRLPRKRGASEAQTDCRDWDYEEPAHVISDPVWDDGYKEVRGAVPEGSGLGVAKYPFGGA